MAMWTSASKLLYGARATVRVFEGVKCHKRQNVHSLILFVNTLVGLRVLDLKGNRIGAEGAKHLNLPANLQTLDLRRNDIGDEGAKHLNLPAKLQTLGLESNDIGDEGAKH